MATLPFFWIEKALRAKFYFLHKGQGGGQLNVMDRKHVFVSYPSPIPAKSTAKELVKHE